MNGPTSPGPVSVQMTCKNASFSGLNFEPSTGYRVSLFKKQIMTGMVIIIRQYFFEKIYILINCFFLLFSNSGRYISEADSTINYACV